MAAKAPGFVPASSGIENDAFAHCAIVWNFDGASREESTAQLRDAGALSRKPIHPRGFGVRQPHAALRQTDVTDGFNRAREMRNLPASPVGTRESARHRKLDCLIGMCSDVAELDPIVVSAHGVCAGRGPVSAGGIHQFVDFGVAVIEIDAVAEAMIARR